MTSPPKPWELSNGTNNSTNSINSMHSSTTTLVSPDDSSATAGQATLPQRPVMPARPTSYGMMQPSGGANYGGGLMGANRFGAGGYGSTYGTGYGTGYGTPGYGSGMYGSSMYGGGMSSMYGNGGMYGSSMYGGNRMGYGANRFGGGMVGPNENVEMSLTQQMEMSTQSTFQILDQIVQAFGGFSQMLESTFFATHSSFMAMIGVADQFGQLRNYLGQVFSILSLYNSVKGFLYRIVGQRPPFDPSSLSVESFNQEMKPKPNRRPLFIFLGLVIGLPYLMAKLIQRMEKNKPALQILQQQQITSPETMRNLEFCKAQFDFVSDTPGDLSFRKGDLVAILHKLEPGSEWWRGRSQDGRIGIFPRDYVSLISRKESTQSHVPPPPS